MEPDHEDREDTGYDDDYPSAKRPQWSPIMKTGKTLDCPLACDGTGCRNGARS